MRNIRALRPVSLAIMTGALLLTAPPAIGGGGPGDIASREDSGTHFFGEVKDVAGFKPLEGVRVKVAVTGTRMFLVVLPTRKAVSVSKDSAATFPGRT